MPASLAVLIELERAVQVAVVGDRQGVHAQLFGPLDQPVDRAGAVEQAVVAMAMQMNKRRRRGRGHGHPLLACGCLSIVRQAESVHSTACQRSVVAACAMRVWLSPRQL